jgi:hypothetical protein
MSEPVGDRKTTATEGKPLIVAVRRSACALFFLALPFVIFYWLLPFYADHTIGNDYPIYAFHGQLALQYPLHQGEFPLYVPAGSLGRPSAFLTLGQLWHPISFIAAHLPGYWNGWALDWNTLLRLLSLGLTHLILFLVLRKVRVATLLAFLISFVTVFNLRMLDMFRYGASLENYTAFLWLCAACAWYFINPTKRAGPVAIIVSTYLLICGGHPQMMYYGLFGAVFVILTTPFFIPVLLPELRQESRFAWRYYMQVGSCVFVGIVMASVYILPYAFDFLAEGGAHIDEGIAFSLGYTDTLYGSLANLFSPLMADVHGAFGGSALPIVAAALPLVLFLGTPIERPVWLYWLAALAVFAWMLGATTPFFTVAWTVMPLSESMRVPGRMAMILPPIIMWLLAWLATRRSVRLAIGKRTAAIPPFAFVALMGLALWMIGNASVLAPDKLGAYFPAKIRHIPAAILYSVKFSGGLSLLLLAGSALPWPRIRRTSLVLAVLLCCAQTTTAIRHGTWIGKATRDHTLPQVEKTFYTHKFAVNRVGLNLMPSRAIAEHLASGGKYEPRIAWLSFQSRVASTREDIYESLRKEPDKEAVILEKSPSPSLPSETSASEGSLVLTHRSANRVMFESDTTAPGFVVFSYPYRTQWRAWVNGHKAVIYRANGIEQAVQIPAGKVAIEFRFWSAATFWGVLMSCLTACGLLTYLAWPISNLRRRIAVIVAVFVLGVALLSYWNHLLYSAPSWPLGG